MIAESRAYMPHSIGSIRDNAKLLELNDFYLQIASKLPLRSQDEIQSLLISLAMTDDSKSQFSLFNQLENKLPASLREHLTKVESISYEGTIEFKIEDKSGRHPRVIFEGAVGEDVSMTYDYTDGFGWKINRNEAYQSLVEIKQILKQFHEGYESSDSGFGSANSSRNTTPLVPRKSIKVAASPLAVRRFVAHSSSVDSIGCSGEMSSSDFRGKHTERKRYNSETTVVGELEMDDADSSDHEYDDTRQTEWVSTRKLGSKWSVGKPSTNKIISGLSPNANSLNEKPLPPRENRPSPSGTPPLPPRSKPKAANRKKDFSGHSRKPYLESVKLKNDDRELSRGRVSHNEFELEDTQINASGYML